MTDAATLPDGRLARLALTLSRDKSDTLLLLAATLLVLAPHAAHLPLWVTAVCAATMGWRALITFRGTRMPPSLLLLPLAVAAMGGIFLTFNTLLGREAGVAMAVLLVTFKMLEMHARRDLFVVIYLCFFLLLTNFFYSQSIGMGVMMVIAIVALLTAQLSFQYTGAVPPLLRRIGVGAKVLGIAAPVALALFVLFPRIQGPLWGMPGDANTGRSGLSNSMSPGNIANLAQSGDTAFRVKFNGAVPRQDQLYWRGLVLADFDGRTWSLPRRRDQGTSTDVQLQLLGNPVDYQVTIEPHREHWLFALDMPGRLPRMPEMSTFGTANMELRAASPVERRMRYDARSFLSYTVDGGPQLPDRARWLALPTGYNPRATQAGAALRAEEDPVKRVAAVLTQYRRGGFSYTLQPPLLGVHSVDEFLYSTRAGFCEHYASSFVFLMRAADVPARVVTGYQGGELNPVDGYVTVRQSDAHAWAEVWLGARGWVRIDPTAAVAPDRVERNLARALPNEQFDLQNLGSLINIQLDQDSWISKLRFQMNALSNGWDQWVLTYDPQRQRNVWQSLKEAFSNWRALAGVAALCILFVIGRTVRLRRRQDPVDALYSALDAQLTRLGLARMRDEGPTAWAARIDGAQMATDKKDAIRRFLQLYSAHKYGATSGSNPIPALKKLLTSSR